MLILQSILLLFLVKLPFASFVHAFFVGDNAMGWYSNIPLKDEIICLVYVLMVFVAKVETPFFIRLITAYFIK